MQIYLLTVLTNLLAGIYLSRRLLAEKAEGFKPFEEMLSKQSFQLVTGILTFLTGIFALFYRVEETSPFIIGNLIPSLSALLCGSLLLSEYFVKAEETEGGILLKLAQFSRDKGYFVGIAAIVIAVIHGIIPSALFL